MAPLCPSNLFTEHSLDGDCVHSPQYMYRRGGRSESETDKEWETPAWWASTFVASIPAVVYMIEQNPLNLRRDPNQDAVPIGIFRIWLGRPKLVIGHVGWA